MILSHPDLNSYKKLDKLWMIGGNLDNNRCKQQNNRWKAILLMCITEESEIHLHTSITIQ